MLLQIQSLNHLTYAEWKDRKWCKNLGTKNFTDTKKLYVHEIAAVNLSKVYFLKNAKETCKPNNRDWIIAHIFNIINIKMNW